MTPDENLAWVAEQMRQCEAGETKMMACPYCLALNLKCWNLCCPAFAAAAKSVIEHDHIPKQ
jgi:hypothetical protein